MTGKATYEVGKGKPPKEYQFRPGDNANPRGKSSAQKKMEVANAELAAKAKNHFLRALVSLQADQSTEQVLANMTGADILRLIKDAEDRAYGTPVQKVDNTSSDGTMTPQPAVSAIDLINERLKTIAERSANTGKPE